MKKTPILFILLLTMTLAFGQKKEKLKGSRIVTVVQKEIGEFENLEVEDNLEVFLVRGEKSALEIEADDNLQSAIGISLSNGTLRLSVSKEITGAKKLSVKVTYTNDLKMLIAKDDTNITALDDIQLDNFTFKTFGSAKVFANIKVKAFTLMGNDKSKSELNVTAENTTIDLNKSAQMKALISSSKMKFDMYQKATATIEGDVIDLNLRLDNNANFTGKNLTVKNAVIIMEGSASSSINVTNLAVVEISGKTETELYGECKVDIKKFIDSASIRKKQVK